MHSRFPIPRCSKTLSHSLLTTLVATTVSDKNDVLKAMHLQAVRYVGQYRLECFLSEADCSWAPHMPALGLDATLRNIFDYRGANGISEVRCDCWAVRA